MFAQSELPLIDQGSVQFILFGFMVLGIIIAMFVAISK